MRLGPALACVAVVSSPSVAQTSPPQDTSAIVAAAERAAVAAEQAAAAADQAAVEADRARTAARTAARSARVAADQARLAAGLRAAPAAPTGSPAATAAVAVAAQPPVNENLPVDHAGGSVATGRSGSDAAERGLFREGLASSVANGPNGGTFKSSPTPDFQLLASSKDKVASVAFTIDVSGQPRTGRLVADQLTVTASGNLDDSGNSDILGLDGPGNGTQLKVSYTHYSSAVHLSGIEKGDVAIARDNCLSTPGVKATDCDPYKYKTGVGSFVAKYNPAGHDRLLDEVMPGSIVFYGLQFTGNQASYKYLDRTAFALRKDDKFGFGAGLFGGLLLGHGQSSITGSFDYRRSFSEQSSVSLCQAVAGTAQTQCLTGADGAPDRSDEAILGVELRQALPVGVGRFATLAFAPRFSADVLNDGYSFTVPLYLAADDAGKLRGGIQATYLNQRAPAGGRKRDFALGLFVGVPFSAFHQP